MTSVEAGWRKFLAALRSVGYSAELLLPPADEAELDQGEVGLGAPIHPDVRQLYSVCGGLPYPNTGWPPEIYVGVEFPPLHEAIRLAHELDEGARAARVPGLWQNSWLPVFVLSADHVVAVDGESGSVWLVSWQDGDLFEVADGLGDFFDQWAALVTDLAITYDPSAGRWQDLAPGFDRPTIPSTPLRRPS